MYFIQTCRKSEGKQIEYHEFHIEVLHELIRLCLNPLELYSSSRILSNEKLKKQYQLFIEQKFWRFKDTIFDENHISLYIQTNNWKIKDLTYQLNYVWRIPANIPHYHDYY